MKPKAQPKIAWSKEASEEHRPFGDRLDMISPEAAHAVTGKLTILPARERK